MKQTANRMVLGAALCVALATFLFIFRPMEATIAEKYTDLDTIRFAMQRDTIDVRRISQRTQERNRIALRLSRYRLHDSRAATIDRFLRRTAEIATRDGVSIQSVTEERTQPVRAAGTQPKDTVTADDLRLDLVVRGPYDDVLRAVRELNDADLALQMSASALGNPDRRAGSRPQLSATFHVVILRESDASAPPSPHQI